MTGLLDPLVADDVADHLLTVLREALANAARHAHSTAVDITAEATATHLRLRVADNGRGIDPARPAAADWPTSIPVPRNSAAPSPSPPTSPPAPPWTGLSPSPPT
ncbi:ATP-binding protein [Streptomyces canus]|uniref:ATP-binding protein n=1 Tax=Streptomyces TaxID=1883 RepID=UPI0036E1B6E1